MKSRAPGKAVTIISFIAAIGGLITLLYPVFEDSGRGFPTTRVILTALFQNVNLDFISSDVLRFRVADTSINIAELCYWLLFISGAIVFSVKGFEHPGIVGFCFAIIFFTQCIGSVFMLYNMIARFDLLRNNQQPYWFFLYLIMNGIWIWLSYYVLKTIQQKRALSIEEYEEGGTRKAAFYTAGKGRRIVHLFVDRIMIILISSNWVLYFSQGVERIEDSIGMQETIMLVTAACMLVYYPFFEGIFAVTPAKFLTATRVADEFGNKPRFGSIIIRTLCRLIPFNAISFLFPRGWHDSISNTYVLQEEAAKDEHVFSFEEPPIQ